MRMSRRSLLPLAAIMAAVAFAPLTLAQYPDRPVKIIVPYPPGGTTDNMVRILAQHIEPHLGQPAVIVNIGGAGGAVGMLEAIQSNPDGYTVGMYLTNTEVAQAVGVAAFKDDDFTPGCLLGDAILTLTANGDGTYDSLADYMKAAKDKGVGLAMGVGSLAQFAAVLVDEKIDGEVKGVNVGSGAQKKAAVLGGHVDAMIEPTPGVIGPHRAGQLKILAVLAPERLAFLPDLPTAKEQGVDVSLSQTNGFIFPKGTPQERIDAFCNAMGKLGDDAAFQDKLAELNVVWRFMQREAFAQHIKKTAALIDEVAKTAGY